MSINDPQPNLVRTRILLAVLCALATGLAGPAAFGQAVPIQTKKPDAAQKKLETVNPAIRPNVMLDQAKVKLLKGQLSKQEHDAILRTHEARVQAQPAGLTARAQTGLRVSTQNNRFRGQYDCDDGNASIKPGATEVCDGVDNDCDGDVDEGVRQQLYLDADNDGVGDRGRILNACPGERGYSTLPQDCDDTNSSVYPGAPDPDGDGVDQDCDGKDG